MALGSLYRRYARPLLKTALRITGSDADSEEAVAETFLALVEGRRKERPGEVPYSYLRRAVVNRSLNLLRARRRRPGSVAPGVLDRRPARERELPLLRDGLARLPDRQAEVFAMRHLDGLAVAEIADALGIAPATVRVHLHRAARALRALFDPKEARHE